MANSVDLDQPAPSEQSDLGLHCLHLNFWPNIKGQEYRYEYGPKRLLSSFHQDNGLLFKICQNVLVYFVYLLAYFSLFMSYGLSLFAFLKNSSVTQAAL